MALLCINHQEPISLRGSVRAPASKSAVHRLLVCAALSERESVIGARELSEDLLATAGALRSLGADVSYDGAAFAVRPIRAVPDAPVLDCGESGTTLRFLLPVAASLTEEARFTGCGRLPERPVKPLLDALRKNGVTADSDRLPLRLCGKLQSGDFSVPGDVSSQFVSGLLLALPPVGGGRVRLTSPLESAPYVALTLDALSTFGVAVEQTEDGWHVPEGQRYRSPGQVDAEGDWTAAANFLAAGAISGDVAVTGLDPASKQGDRAIMDILRRFGAKLETEEDRVRAQASRLHAAAVDLRDTPDLLPALAVLAAFAEGESLFTGGARLRSKESDRLASAAALLRALGGDVTETDNGLRVRGTGLRGGTVDAAQDHRIVMAAAIAGCCAAGPVTVRGAEAVRKSYPDFFRDLQALGGKTDGVGLW